MIPVLLGVVAGSFASWLASSLLARFLFDVAPTDPVSFLAAAGTLVLAGVVAALVPALRASGTDPATALRAE
jgi:ABC-type antimicrobial peptide transport system permease subunit